MSTTALEIVPATQRTRTSPSRRRSLLAAIYIGTMPGFEHLPSIDLYNLLVPVGEHPVGSTVSRRTLEKHGISVPLMGSPRRSGDAGTDPIQLPALQVA